MSAASEPAPAAAPSASRSSSASRFDLVIRTVVEGFDDIDLVCNCLDGVFVEVPAKHPANRQWTSSGVTGFELARESPEARGNWPVRRRVHCSGLLNGSSCTTPLRCVPITWERVEQRWADGQDYPRRHATVERPARGKAVQPLIAESTPSDSGGCPDSLWPRPAAGAE